MNKETLRMQLLSGVITEGEYKAKLEEIGMFNDPIGYEKSEPNPKDEIFTKKYKGNGMYVIYKNGKEVKTIEGEGNANAWINDEKKKLKENKKSLNENFVGMGMVGNIFDREKTDYELAFEHFTKGTSLNEVEEEDKEPLKEIDYKSLADVDKETSISSLKSNLYYYGYAPMALQYSDDKDDSYILNDLKRVMKQEMKKRGYTENPTLNENFIQGDETVKNQVKAYFEEMARESPENLASVLTGLVMGEDPTFGDFVRTVSNYISGEDNPFGLD